jgi:hypothetical protein
MSVIDREDGGLTRRSYRKPELKRLGLLRHLTRFSF